MPHSVSSGTRHDLSPFSNWQRAGAEADCAVMSDFFFSSRRRHTRSTRDWSSDVCSSDLQQRFEADFRFSLVRFRENAESVALYGGEPVELRVFNERFRSVFENFRHIMKRQRRLTCFTLGYTQVALIFSLAVVSPRYFAKQIGWGGLMQVVSAFSFVQNSLSFIINAYTDIAAWQAVTQRLSGFEQQLLAIHQSKRAARQINIRRGDIGVAVKEIDLDLPNGTSLLRDVAFSLARGEALLIEGPTGAGKSTLLRAIAGCWRFGCGEISRPHTG